MTPWHELHASRAMCWSAAFRPTLLRAGGSWRVHGRGWDPGLCVLNMEAIGALVFLAVPGIGLCSWKVSFHV